MQKWYGSIFEMFYIVKYKKKKKKKKKKHKHIFDLYKLLKYGFKIFFKAFSMIIKKKNKTKKQTN